MVSDCQNSVCFDSCAVLYLLHFMGLDAFDFIKLFI